MTDSAPGRSLHHFNRVFRGYEPAVVDTALEVAAREIEDLREQLAHCHTDVVASRNQLTTARLELDRWRAREERIVELSLSAEREAHHTIERAERQAEIMLDRATHEAEDVISARRMELRTLQGRIEGLTRLRQDVRSSVSATIFGLERATLELREGLSRIEQLHLETTTRQLAEAVASGETEPEAVELVSETPAQEPSVPTATPSVRFPSRSVRQAMSVAVEVYPVDSYAALRSYVRPLEHDSCVESVEVARFVDDTAELIIHTYDVDELRMALAHRAGTVVEQGQANDALSVRLESGSIVGDLTASITRSSPRVTADATLATGEE